MKESVQRAQRKYAVTDKGVAAVKKYETSPKGRARKSKWVSLMTPEQQEKQRESKRLSAQRRRAKKKSDLGVDTLL